MLNEINIQFKIDNAHFWHRILRNKNIFVANRMWCSYFRGLNKSNSFFDRISSENLVPIFARHIFLQWIFSEYYWVNIRLNDNNKLKFSQIARCDTKTHGEISWGAANLWHSFSKFHSDEVMPQFLFNFIRIWARCIRLSIVSFQTQNVNSEDVFIWPRCRWWNHHK